MMEFILTYCVICALAFVLVVLGMSVMLLLKGTVGVTGALCIGFARVVEFLQQAVLGRKAGGRYVLDQRALKIFYLVVYIVIIALIANIT